MSDVLGIVNIGTEVETLGDRVHSPVADLTALAALSGADLDDGGIYPCNDDGTGDPALYVYDAASTEAASPPDIVAVTAGGRMYVRRGPAGADGADGDDGADGKTVRNGTGAPAAELGVDGDFYIDTTAWEIYGPKATTWGVGTSLVGADGDDGADGATWTSGSGEPTGGVQGDLYLRTDTGAVYLRGASTWSIIASTIGPQGPEGPAGTFDVGDGEVTLATAVVTAGGGNTGVGSMAVASGTRSGLFEIEILTTGDLGVATFRWRMRGGAWQDNSAAGYATAADVELTGYDADKEASVPSGQHVQMTAGGEGDDFVDGDTFTFTPVLSVTMNHAGGEITVPLVMPEGDYDDFSVLSTEIAAGQKVICDGVMQPAASGGFTGDSILFVVRKTVAAGSITFRALNMGAAADGKAKMTFAGLPE